MTSRPRLCLNKKRIIRGFISFLSDLKPFITSHHPDCNRFRGHYITIRGVKLCIGCFFSLSTALVVLLYHIVFGVWTLFPKNIIIYIISALVYATLYASGLFGKSKALKILSKIVFATIFVIILIYVYGLPYPSSYMRILMTLIVFVSVNYIVGAIRLYGMFKVCDRCPEKELFPFCSGFKEIVDRLISDNFARLC